MNSSYHGAVMRNKKTHMHVKHLTQSRVHGPRFVNVVIGLPRTVCRGSPHRRPAAPGRVPIAVFAEGAPLCCCPELLHRLAEASFPYQVLGEFTDIMIIMCLAQCMVKMVHPINVHYHCSIFIVDDVYFPASPKFSFRLHLVGALPSVCLLGLQVHKAPRAPAPISSCPL